MKTQFKNLNDLKNNISIGQQIYVENYIKPERSRVTKVKNKQSYFFTIENLEGIECWLINGATTLKEYGFNFIPEMEKVDIFYKKDFKPYVSIYFNDTIIKGKNNK